MSDSFKVLDENGNEIKDTQNGTEQRAYDDALERYNRANDDFNTQFNSELNPISESDSNVVSRKQPAESLSAQGYNSPSSTSYSKRPSSLPKDNNSFARDSIGGNNGLDQNSGLNGRNEGLPVHENGPQARPNETAPDIGKDYGSSMPNDERVGDNGYNPYPDTPGSEGEEQVERQVPQEASQQGNQLPPEGQTDDELGKKDGLDNQEEQKKPGENQLEGQQQEKKPEDPTAKGYEGGQQQEKKTPTGDSPAPGGNGYGALKNKSQAPATNDSTANARRNLEHANRMREGQAAERGKPSPSLGKKSSLPAKKSAGLGGIGAGIGASLKKGIKNFFNRNEVSDSDKGGEEQDNSFLGDLMRNLMSSILSNPYALIIIAIVILLILIILAVLDDDWSMKTGRGSKTCTYNLAGISSTGNVELTDLKVEVVNCDATKDNYKVLETVDFEKYILGVALAEAGPSSPDEALKAQMIAVRNFSLTRHLGMCPSNPDNCFHGYNASTGVIRMRACTNDQVYWDYTKDCPAQDRDGQPTLYCVGVENPNKTWKKALSAERQAQVEALAAEVAGEVLLDENGNVMKLGYKAPQTEQFIEMANNGSDYVSILSAVYGSDTIGEAECSYNGNMQYFDYQLTSDGDTILHQPLEEFLDANGSSLEKFNDLIEDHVEEAGYGTRAGVVAAAVTLIGELGDEYNVKVPYYWGGGHYDGVVVGALGYWGSTQCHTYANGQHYNYCGFDCSGFVPWAIKNGGFNKGVGLASDFQYMSGAKRVGLNSGPVLKPGDLLESEGHVILVVGIDEESNQYICAEAMGNAYGVLFTRRAFNLSGYWGVDLEEYYNNPANVREQS